MPDLRFYQDVDRDTWRAVHDHDEYGVCGFRFAPGDVVVDVGAHVGSFSTIAVNLGAGRVYAVEPFHTYFDCLNHNLAVALPGEHRRRVVLVRAAVWGVGKNPDGLPEGLPEAGCPCVTLDALVGLAAADAPAGRVRLLKVDAEGAEFPALLTARRLGLADCVLGEYHDLARHRPGVVPAVGLPGPFTPGRLRACLEAQGFLWSFRDTGNGFGLFRAWRPGKEAWR